MHWLSSLLLLTTIDMLELHGPDGQTVFINDHEISSLRAPTTFDLRRHFPKGTSCVVLTTDGKFIAIVESCKVILDMIRENKQHAKQK